MSLSNSSRHRLLTSSAAFLMAASSLGALAADAQAAIRCGRLRVNWNAPEGAAVVTRVNGEVISAVFDSAGRYFTHVVLSHGQSGISQSHRGTPKAHPDRAAQLYSTPLLADNLRNGGPGPSRTNLAGAYASIGYEHALYFAGNEKARQTARFLDAHERTSPVDGLSRYLFGGLARPYSFLNFKASLGSQIGIADPTGFACSNFLAYAVNRASNGAIVIPTEGFNDHAVYRGLKAAHDQTEHKCNTEVVDRIANSIERDFARSHNVCGRAGEQVANCLAGVDNYSCGRTDSAWHDGNRWFGGRTASVLGPDRLVNFGAGAVTSNPSPWAPNNGTAPFGRSLRFSSDPGTEVFGCWAAAEDIPDNTGFATRVGAEHRGQETVVCQDTEVLLPGVRVPLNHLPGHGDSEMNGNHPNIRGDVYLQRQGDALVVQSTLRMTEGGGDRSTFTTPGNVAHRRVVYTAPAHCEIQGVISSVRSFSGWLNVPDAGVNNHGLSSYGAPQATGGLRSAQCQSDTNGNDYDRLFCNFNLHPVTVQLRPRFNYAHAIAEHIDLGSLLFNTQTAVP